MSDAFVFILLGAGAFLLGLRGSIRLTRRYLDVTPRLIPRERAILGALVVVAWVITLGGGYFVTISMLRISGYVLPPGTPIVSIIIAALILFIPAALDQVVSRVARVPA